jgi:hypothetical protein
MLLLCSQEGRRLAMEPGNWRERGRRVFRVYTCLLG